MGASFSFPPTEPDCFSRKPINIVTIAGWGLLSGLWTRCVVHTQYSINRLYRYSGCSHRMAHRKWKEMKQQPGMLPGPAVPGCCLVSFHFLWGKLSTRTVYQCAPFPPPCRYLASTCEGVSFLFLCQKMLTFMAIEGEGLYFGRVAFPTEFTLLCQYQHKTLASDYSTI